LRRAVAEGDAMGYVKSHTRAVIIPGLLGGAPCTSNLQEVTPYSGSVPPPSFGGGEADEDHHVSRGVLGGAVVGAFVFVLILGGIIGWRWKKNRTSAIPMELPTSQTTVNPVIAG
jgi:hypothetical protein